MEIKGFVRVEYFFSLLGFLRMIEVTIKRVESLERAIEVRFLIR